MAKITKKTDNGNFGGGMVQKLLTFMSLLVLAMCAWKFFGPGSADARNSGAGFLRGTYLGGFGKMFFISIAVVCFGYLLWRFLSFLFWHKYFKDKHLPPENDDE